MRGKGRVVWQYLLALLLLFAENKNASHLKTIIGMYYPHGIHS